MFSPVVATLPNANRLNISPSREPESSILAQRKTKFRTFFPSDINCGNARDNDDIATQRIKDLDDEGINNITELCITTQDIVYLI